MNKTRSKSSETASKSSETASKSSVLITTQHRGIFWGALEDSSADGRTVTLTGVRCAIRWATKKGFLELAQAGPNASSLVGAAAPRITLYDVTSITECTPEATTAWKAAP